MDTIFETLSSLYHVHRQSLLRCTIFIYMQLQSIIKSFYNTKETEESSNFILSYKIIHGIAAYIR